MVALTGLKIPTHEEVRSWFPTLSSDFVYLENAGGSQVPAVVAEAIKDYMLSSYVQLGAGYPASVMATSVVADAHAFKEQFVNGVGIGRVILGPSTTALCHILARAYGDILKPGDEVVISEAAHESNAGPWEKLEKDGVVIRIWHVDKETESATFENLAAVLNESTKIVAFPHVSNLLGEVTDAKKVCEMAHAVGAKVVCDGVAYASHAAVDVRDLGVDWYVYSAYKVYGPHMSVMFGRNEALAELTGPNHFFIPKDLIPNKFELGGCSHEGCAGLLGLRPYIRFLSGEPQEDFPAIAKAFAVMHELEKPGKEMLLSYLRAHPRVRIVGNPTVGTISFLHESKSSPEICAQTDQRGIGIRFGHMYAYRLCKALGIDTLTGVVRVSMVHYNTPAEIKRLLDVFDEIL